MINALDQIALFYIRRRLPCFQRRGDRPDHFADHLLAQLAAEIDRRNRLFDDWKSQTRRETEEAAEKARREAAIHQFEVFWPGNGLGMQ